MRKGIFLIALLLALMILGTACAETSGNVNVPNYIKKETSVYSTNLDGVSITPYAPGKESKIIFPDGREEEITRDYIALFVNGNLIENAGVFIENDRVVAPVALVAKNLHLGTEWNVITRKLTVFDGTKVIEVFVDDKLIKIGDELIELETYPAIVGDRLYATAEFFRKALGAEVAYYNGTDETGIKIVPNLRQVMFSRFPKEEPVVTVEEALQFVKDDVITAYEKKYTKFEPMEVGAEFDKENQADAIRAGIRDLYVITSNDRFYIMHLLKDIFVDKYTGELFTLDKGDTMKIQHFNPYSEDALTF